MNMQRIAFVTAVVLVSLSLLAWPVAAQTTLTGDIEINQTVSDGEQLEYVVADGANVSDASMTVSGRDSTSEESKIWSEQGDGSTASINVGGTAKTDLNVEFTGVQGFDPSNVSLSETLSDPSNALYDVAWSSDGSLLAVAAGGDGVYVYDDDYNLVKTLDTSTDLNDNAISVAWSGDGILAVGTQSSGDVHAFDSSNWSEISNSPFTNPTDNINDLDWTDDGSKLAVGSQDNNVYILDSDFSETANSPLNPASSIIGSVSWHTDGDYLAAGTYEDVYIYDSTFTNTDTITVNTASVMVESLSWSPNGGYLAATDDGLAGVRIYDSSAGFGEISDSPLPTGNTITSVSWHPAGDYIAAGVSGQAEIFDTTDWSEISDSPVTDPGGGSTIVGFSPNGNLAIGDGANLETYVYEGGLGTIDPSLDIAGSTVSYTGELAAGESYSETITSVPAGSYDGSVSLSSGVTDLNLSWVETTETIDPTVEISSDDGTQTIGGSSVGTLSDGSTADLSSSIDESRIGGDVTLSVNVSESVTDGPPGQVELNYSHSAEFSDADQLNQYATLDEKYQPSVSNPTPDNGGALVNDTADVSALVSGGSLPIGGEVRVEIEAAGNTDLNTTITAEQRAGTQLSTVVGGRNDWTITAADNLTGDTVSKTYSFDAPGQLEIRDVTDQSLVDNDSSGNPIQVEVEFFGSDGSVASRSTTNGSVDMTGLPADERFSVTVDANGSHVIRQAIIPSILEQQTVWLLPQDANVTTVETRLTVQDPTDRFPSDESEIILERPIDRGNGTEYYAVAGDRAGLNGFDVILEQDQRYRIIVRNPNTDAERRLGAFTPTQSEAVTLKVEDIEFDSTSNVEGLEWAAHYIDNENSQDQIEFIFRDTFETQLIDYAIYERGNKSNMLVNDSGTGNITVTEPVPAGESDTVWTVEWTAERGTGETLSATRPVSTDNLPVGPPSFPDRWQVIVSMLALMGVAGLFGAANPGLGGIAVASTGGFLFLIGWLPDRTGGIMVVLALFIAALSYAGRRARGATA